MDTLANAGTLSGVVSGAGNLTYCGSATGNNTQDADHDGAVTCEEAGYNPVSVRWCLKSECECHPGGSTEELEPIYGELEATKAQGCTTPEG